MNEHFNDLKSKGPLKVLIVSQKGGVGKSTLSANLSAYCGRIKKKETLLLDCDPHASASIWLNALKPEKVEVKHHLIDDFTAKRWFIGMRTILRKNLIGYDIIVCDLTWTKSMSSEFVKEFDLIIIPTSVSLIEIDATNIFIEQNLKKITRNSNGNYTPDLLICPSQVIDEELRSNPFDSRTFDFPFLLLPPIPSDPEIRTLFEKGYAFESGDCTSKAFKKVFESILQAGRLKKLKYRENINANPITEGHRANHKTTVFGEKRIPARINGRGVPTSQKDNVVRMKKFDELNKVKRILSDEKNQKVSWFRRLVSW